MLMLELQYLQHLELSLVEDSDVVVDSEIDSMRSIAPQMQDVIRYHSLRRLYVEVGGDRSFELLWELLVFCPNLIELHVHFVRGSFANALAQCRRLHEQLDRLETFTFTSELPASVQFPYEPDQSLTFTNGAAVCANVRHDRSHDWWSCVKLRQLVRIRDRSIILPSQLVAFACGDSMPGGVLVGGEPATQLGSRPRTLSPAFTRGALHGVVPEGARRQSSVRTLPIACPNLKDLDVRVVTRNYLRCSSCHYLLKRTVSVQEPSNAAVSSPTSITRLTLCDVPCQVLLFYVQYYGAATTLRLAEWCFVDSPQYSHLFGLLGNCAALRCLVLQHQDLPINDQHLQASLSRLTSLQHLCLLTSMLVSDADASQCVLDSVARSFQLKCLHIHYRRDTDSLEQRVTWLTRGQGEDLSRDGPCFACCSTATFIGLVKPVNRDCEADL
ncbi:hypothetical protein MTO96_011551 [Rhipicephalus appendiculatus]